MTVDEPERLVIVDASVLITLAAIDASELLRNIRGEILLPAAVVDEITEPPASDIIADSEWISRGSTALLSPVQMPEMEEAQERAEGHIGRSADNGTLDGDIAILTRALWERKMSDRDLVVLTDDKPLRKTCKALSIPLSGSIGVLIRGVEGDDIEASEAKKKVRAMDEVGARLSVSLLERAVRLIEDAAD